MLARYGVSVHPAGGDSRQGAVLVHVRIADEAAPAPHDAATLGTITFHDGRTRSGDHTLRRTRVGPHLHGCHDGGALADVLRELLMAACWGARSRTNRSLRSSARTHSGSGLMRASQSIRDLMSPDAAALPVIAR